MSLSGQTLGEFELMDEIGRGGMGVVYRARQTSLEREVAVKVLPPELSAQGHVAERFGAEAQRMARLSHPSIAQVYTVGREGDTHYFAMQYLTGGTLEDRLRQGPLSVDEACRIAAEVAEALEHAHAEGITHRDIKPANIMFDSHGNAIVTDFGIAKAADDVRLTATGMAVGTPQYMAPEQARGNPTDHRADIYSLGAVMYAMVCGRPPFSGETPVSIAMKHMSETPLPPQAFRGDVPDWLQSVILKALAKEPADRFTTAGDMARALAAAMPVGPVPKTRPEPGPGETTEPPKQPNWLPVIIGVLVMLGVGLIAGVAMQKDTGTSDGPGPLRTVTAPGVVGMTAAAAEAQLRNTGGFDVHYNEARYSEDFAEGLILSQDPPAGSELARRAGVYIVKILGPPPDAPDGPEGDGSEILPQSDDRPLTGDDLTALPNWTLTLARNEIYARHGRRFQKPAIQSHFDQRSWYHPVGSGPSDFSESVLSRLEKKNAAFIREYQKQHFNTPATGP